MRKFLMVASMAVLAGCLAPVKQAAPVSLTSAQVAQIKAAQSYNLYDPASAQFRSIRAARVVREDGTTGIHVCGEINGKNQYGGYVGFEPFAGEMIDGVYQIGALIMACEAS